VKGLVTFVLSVAWLLGQGLQPITTGVGYPALARAARIQGTVKFDVSVKEGKASVALISGHPSLAPSAQQALEKWPFEAVADGQYRVNYVYQLVYPVYDYEVVYRNRGNAFERFFLHIFHRPTMVEERQAVERPNQLKINARVETLDGYPGAIIVVQALVIPMRDYAHRSGRAIIQTTSP
jgi:hypothetical protein